jgi:hypothetical protein
MLDSRHVLQAIMYFREMFMVRVCVVGMDYISWRKGPRCPTYFETSSRLLRIRPDGLSPRDHNFQRICFRSFS